MLLYSFDNIWVWGFRLLAQLKIMVIPPLAPLEDILFGSNIVTMATNLSLRVFNVIAYIKDSNLKPLIQLEQLYIS